MAYKIYITDNITEAVSNEIDIWGFAEVMKGKYGVEYELYKEDGEDYSAIYFMETDDEGYWDTDTSTYRPYKINFADPQWKQKLIDTMKETLIQFIKGGR